MILWCEHLLLKRMMHFGMLVVFQSYNGLRPSCRSWNLKGPSRSCKWMQQASCNVIRKDGEYTPFSKETSGSLVQHILPYRTISLLSLGLSVCKIISVTYYVFYGQVKEKSSGSPITKQCQGRKMLITLIWSGHTKYRYGNVTL